MDDNPTLSQSDVLENYLDKLAEETVEGSCINQTKSGCGLPREMRCDNCNLYFCQEIRKFHEAVADPESEVSADVSLVAVQRAYVHWDRESDDACRDIVSVNVLETGDTIELDLSELDA